MWVNKGLLFKPGQYWWCQTHGMLPVVDHMRGNMYRIYFSGRDKFNESHIGWIEVAITDGTVHVLGMPKEPLLSKGELGTFDDCGVSPLWAVNSSGKLYLYYMGWHRDGVVRASEMTGLAVFQDGKLIERSRSPILKTSQAEPFSILVLTCISGGKAYYDSCDRWVSPEMPNYNIKEAYMDRDWVRTGQVAIDYAEGETRVSCGRRLGDEMFFCSAKDGGYKLGCAKKCTRAHGDVFNDDHWHRQPIDIPHQDWDYDEKAGVPFQCYPFPLIHNGQKLLFFNGSNYGKTGFGYATED